MKLGKSAKGLSSNNDTALEVTQGIRKARLSPTTINNAWRKAKEEDPMLEFRMSFMEWKRRYEREHYRKRRNKISQR